MESPPDTASSTEPGPRPGVRFNSAISSAPANSESNILRASRQDLAGTSGARTKSVQRRKPGEKRWSIRRVMRGRTRKKPQSQDNDCFNVELGVSRFWDEVQPKATMMHKDNIYTFALFMPAYERHVHRHYCRPGVLLALVLLAVNACLQVGLILIAGGDIHKAKVKFTNSLVRDVSAFNFASGTPFEEFFVKSVQTFNDYRESIVKKFSDEKAQARCCNSAHCAELHLPCCDRSHVYKELVEKAKDKDGKWSPLSDNLEIGKNFNRLSKSLVPLEISEEAELMNEILTTQIAVCLRSEGHLDCTPASFRFTQAWDDLDTDKDGVWTLDEARVDAANLGCKFGVPAEDIFRSTCRGISKDAEDTAANSYTIPLIPESIEKRESIPKDYFQWWSGLSVLCVNPDASRCSEFVARGFFDMPLKMKNRVSRGGVADLDTALDFCQRLLRSGGICEKSLPSSYIMYRARVADKCGQPMFSPGKRHSNPFDSKDVMSTLEVSYSNYNQYASANSFRFKFFLFLILMIWYFNLVGELMELIRFADFLWNMHVDSNFTIITPKARETLREWHSQHMAEGSWLKSHLPEKSYSSLSDYLDSPVATPRSPHAPVGEELQDEHDDDGFVMQSMSHTHYQLSLATFFMRLFLFLYIAQTGTVFLLNNYSYDDLLMNAVALAFIFEVPDSLYWFLIPDSTKERFDGARTVEFTTALPTAGIGRILISRTFAALFLCAPLVVMVMNFNLTRHIRPSLDALNCVCFQRGETCSIAGQFTKEWWDQYWLNTTDLAEQRANWIHLGG